MHLIMGMATRLPITVFIAAMLDVPPGFDHVITNTGAFVVTARGNYVIAKSS